MKLASLEHGRDGRLVVVSRDLTRATDAFTVVPTLQAALDDWQRHGPRLADLAESLEHGSVPSFRFHEHDCAAPLPRAFAGLGRDGEGGLRRLASDGALGPRQPASAESEESGIGFRQGIAAITDDVPSGIGAEAARGHIRLIMLSNRMNPRNQNAKDGGQAPDETRFPQAAYSPVCVTSDELGAAWTGSALKASLAVQINGRPFADLDATGLDLAALVSAAAAASSLSAGTILSATVAIGGTAAPALRFGDTLRLEARDGQGHSLFGAIEQELRPRS